MRKWNKKPPFRFVRVWWRDAEADSDWNSVEQIHEESIVAEELPVQTVGYVVQDDDKWLVVSSTMGWGNDAWLVTNSMRIPRGMISAIEDING